MCSQAASALLRSRCSQGTNDSNCFWLLLSSLHPSFLPTGCMCLHHKAGGVSPWLLYIPTLAFCWVLMTWLGCPFFCVTTLLYTILNSIAIFFLLLKIQVYCFCILELLFALVSQGFALTFFISIDFSSTLRHKVTGLATANCLRLFIACVSVPLKTCPPI